MAQYVKQGDIFGRIGSNIGQGLAEQIPKEVERNRLSTGLKELNQRRNLSPQEYFTGALGIPGVMDRPQVLQSLENLSRQRAVIDSIKQQQQDMNRQLRSPQETQRQPEISSPTSATTIQGVQSALNPYIPPSGQEVENMARQLVANEPYIYPNIEAARQAVNNKIAADVNQSNSRIAKRDLEQSVQTKAENELTKEIQRLGVQIPGRALSRLESEAIERVRKGELTEKDAAKEYGEKAEAKSRDYSKIRGWGGIDLITNKPKDLFSAIKSIRKNNPDLRDRRDLAEEMIGETLISPELAHAQMLPVSENNKLHEILRSLPNIERKVEKVAGLPGLAGMGVSPTSKKSKDETRKIAPELLKAMGTTGSPLAIKYELDKKGYDGSEWTNYLADHRGELTGDQYSELGFTQKSFMALLNDLWFKYFMEAQ